MVKNGTSHLKSLQDGRDIRLNGERITDPTEHPAFRNACRTAAAFYDFQARTENQALMTFGDGNRRACQSVLGSFPRATPSWWSAEARLLEAWAELHLGFFGRSPDRRASTLSGFTCHHGHRCVRGFTIRRVLPRCAITCVMRVMRIIT